MEILTNLQVFPSYQGLSQATAVYITRLAAEATTNRGSFTVAFSGGSLPKLVCPALMDEPLRSQIDWKAWYVFFADERCVRLTHPDSNYRLLLEEFLSHTTIPSTQVFAMNDQLPPTQAAQAYQDALSRVFQPAPGQFPRLDLILLGMGEDGHTASLFPHHPLLDETERWVAPIFDSPKPPPERITLTLPVINNARHVAFVVTGAGKAEILPQAIGAIDAANRLPARLVQPDGRLDWFVDEAAAARLNL